MNERPISLAWVNLTHGGMSGGYQKYMEAVLPRLATDQRFGPVSVLSPEAMRGVVVPAGAVEWTWPPSDPWLGFPNLRRQLQAIDSDIIYVPSARFVSTGRSRFVVMFRNMEPVTRPFGENGFAEGAKNVARRIAGLRACSKADSVIAVSRFVADFLTSRWSVPSRKITVIYHGLTDPPDEPLRPSNVDDRMPFVFAAGSIRPFRGLEDLIGALAYLPSSLADLRVVIAGRIEGRVNHYVGKLHNLAESLGVARRITWAGYLRTTEMSWCFRNCSAFAMTSRVEACPNTALEAMHHGVACVATTNRPMPEFFGEAALYYSAGDQAGLAAALAALSSDSALRKRFQSAARTRTQSFTWERTVELTAAHLLGVARQPVSGYRP